MSEKEAVDLALRSIKTATMRDSFSGDGIDVLVITKQGIKEFTEKL
jgi:proteasome beta subunit